MATPDEIKKFRSYFTGLLTDQNVLNGAGHQKLMGMLATAKQAGFVDDSYIANYQSYRQKRMDWVRSQPLVDQSTGQPLTKQASRFEQTASGPQRVTQTVQATGADLFAGGEFRPDLSPATIAKARSAQLAGLTEKTQTDLERLKKVREALHPSTAIGNVGMGLQALSESVRSLPTTTQMVAAGLPGIGELVKPPSVEEIANVYLPKSISEIAEMTPEQARLEAMKPARAAGFTGGQELAQTIGGIAGSALAGSLLTASGLSGTVAAPIAVPLAVAGASFAGGLALNALQEMLLKRAYGSEWDSKIKPILQQAQEESGATLGSVLPGLQGTPLDVNIKASTAGSMANVLLQGSPVLSSGLGGRRVAALYRAARLGKNVAISGTQELLGAGSSLLDDTARAALASEQIPTIARTGGKFNSFVSNLLTNAKAASDEAAQPLFSKTFRPQSETWLGRQKELYKFINETPGANEFLADALGEQAVSLGQTAADYAIKVKNGEQVNPTEMLADLAFGSLFIGNNKFTSGIDSLGRMVGGGALSAVGKIPGLGGPVEALRDRYGRILEEGSITGQLANEQVRAVRQAVQSPEATPYQTEMNIRERITPTGPLGSQGLQPHEMAVPLGDGKVSVLDTQTGQITSRWASDMFGGVDDNATVTTGTNILESLNAAATVRKGRDQILPAFGDANQTVVGISRVQNTDDAHAIVREVYTTKGEDGRPRASVQYDILPVKDLEKENQPIAAGLIERAGLIPTDQPYQAVGAVGEDASAYHKLAYIKTFQDSYREAMPELANQFPTPVQFDEGTVLWTRILGQAENGDLTVQLMSPGMDIVRVGSQNVVNVKRGSEVIVPVTQQLKPISIGDQINEVFGSQHLVPTPERKDIFKAPNGGYHSISTGGEGFGTVKLTQEQQDRVPDAMSQMQQDIAQAQSMGKSPGAATAQAKSNALKAIFGDARRPESNYDYEPGTGIQVRTKDGGTEYGVIVGNTDMGPLVVLRSANEKPVVVQDEDIVGIAGAMTDKVKPEKKASAQGAGQPKAEAARAPKQRYGLSVADYAKEDLPDGVSVYDAAQSVKGNVAKGRVFLAQGMKLNTQADPFSDLFGFTKNDDGSYTVKSAGDIKNRINEIISWLQTAVNAEPDDSVKTDFNNLIDGLKDAYADIERMVKDGDIVLREPVAVAKPKAGKPAANDQVAAAQQEAIEEAYKNGQNRKLDPLIVDAILGFKTSALLSTDTSKPSEVVTLIERRGTKTVNHVQDLIRILYNDPSADLTARQQKIAEALGFPDPKEIDNLDWYRGAFQSIEYINKGNVRKLVNELWFAGKTKFDGKISEPIPLSAGPNAPTRTLSEAEIKILKDSGFIIGEKLDVTGIKILSGTERGLIFGTGYFQAGPAGVSSPVDASSLFDSIAFSLRTGPKETTNFQTTLLRSKDKASFTANLRTVLAGTAAAQGITTKQLQEKIDAVVDLYDSFVHGASSNLIRMTMEAVRGGHLAVRGQLGTVQPTRNDQQMRNHPVDSVLKADLLPVYNRLRELLELPKTADLTTYIDKPDNQGKLKVAIAKLNEELVDKFYSERMGALANFDVVPDVADINGYFLDIYDPAQESAVKVVCAFASANVDTFLHELAHVYFEAMPLPMQKELSSALGHTLRVPTVTNPSTITYEAHEKFAYGLEVTIANPGLVKTWIGTNGQRGAAEYLAKVLGRASDALVSTYQGLAERSVKRQIRGQQVSVDIKSKEWAVPYQADGRIFLWEGVPVILDPKSHPDTRYAIVNEQFGTTTSPERLVEIRLPDGTTKKIPNGDIIAIGAPSDGLNPAVMQILSQWIADKQGIPGLVRSTPEERRQALVRNAAGEIVGVNVQSRVGGAKGDVTNANIDSILATIGLSDIAPTQYDIIRKYLGNERLKEITDRLRILSRDYIKNRLKSTLEDNSVLALTGAYAEARIVQRLRDIVRTIGSTPQANWNNDQRAAKKALDFFESTSKNAPNGPAFWAAVRAAERVIYANRWVMNSVAGELTDIARGAKKGNWTLQRLDSAKQIAYLVQRVPPVGGRGRPTEVKWTVDLKSGVATVQNGPKPAPVNVETGIITVPASPEFAQTQGAWMQGRYVGGEIPAINNETKQAFDKVGISKDSFRVFSPQYFIADALIKEAQRTGSLGPEVTSRPSSLLFQTAQRIAGLSPADTDVTLRAQISQADLNKIVSPQIVMEDAGLGDSVDVIEFAIQQGDVAAAMQNTGDVVVRMDRAAEKAKAEWVEATIKALTDSAAPELAKMKAAWEKQNPGQTAVLYRYEAYVETEIFDTTSNTPWYYQDIPESEIQKYRKAIEKNPDDSPVRRERVKVFVFSHEKLKGRGTDKETEYYDSDRWANADDADRQRKVRTVSRLDFGGSDVWVDTGSQTVVDPTKGSVASNFVSAATARVNEIAAKWSSQYNPATDTSTPVSPVQAWKPSSLTMTAKTVNKTVDGISMSVFYAQPKVSAEPYALDKVAGNEGWSALKTVSKTTLKVTSDLDSTRKILAEQFAKTKQHQVGVIQLPTRVKGAKPKFRYVMAIRDERMNLVFIKDDNNGAGYETPDDAIKEAQKEHGRLFGLAREKQEEEVSRRVAAQFIDIIKTGRDAMEAQRQGKTLTKDQMNALNILKQFTWYKSMEERLVGTYGPFATQMADLLGATSPQTPVWQNYLATMFLLQSGAGTHNRRVKISPDTVKRNTSLQAMVNNDNRKFGQIMAVVKSDMSRTLTVRALHEGLIRKFVSKALPEGDVDLTVDNYKTVMADALGDRGETAASWVSLFEREVPANKRAEVLRAFVGYLNANNPSRVTGGKDIQFRSFVNEVDDWVSPVGEVLHYKGKGKQPERLGVLKDVTLPLSETVVPRNLTSGALFGSNSQNVVLALANEWLNVSEGQSPKARNFAMNFIGLSKGATIDVWAARLTRRHLNEHFMGVRTKRVVRTENGKPVINPATGDPYVDTVTEIVDPQKYENWLALPEAERKQYFRLAPSQEQGVQGGYIANLKNAVKSNGYIGGTGQEQVEIAPEERQYTDVRDARISGEFGAANRIFALATDKVNGYIQGQRKAGERGFMSASDLQAVVWFAEKALWVQNGWTSAAGAGGSFEQMYQMMAHLSGGYERGAATVRVGMRQGGVNLTNREMSNVADLLMAPFIRERRLGFQQGVGDVQGLSVYDNGEETLTPPSFPALMVNAMSRQEFNESVESKVSGQFSVAGMVAPGRAGFDEAYTGDVPVVAVAYDRIEPLSKELAKGNPIFLAVKDATKVRNYVQNNGVGQRTVFGTVKDGLSRYVGSAVVDGVAIVQESDVPEQFRVAGNEYVRLDLRPEQFLVNSKVFMHKQRGKDLQTDVWGQALTKPELKNAPKGIDAHGLMVGGIDANTTFVGSIPVGFIPKANKMPKDTILPRQPRISAVAPGRFASFHEAAINLLSAYGPAQDGIVTRIRTVESQNDPLWDGRSDSIGKVPGPNAFMDVDPNSNLRYGTFLLLEAPVGQQRNIQSEQVRIMDKVRRILTRLTNDLPNLGYVIRIDGHASDVHSDVTGTKGAPAVEIAFSPEQFLRDFQPITEVNGERPSNADQHQAIFDAYSSGDVTAIREYEKEFVTALRNLVSEIDADPDTAGGIVLRAESVYNVDVIPKERLKAQDKNNYEFANDEYARRHAEGYGIGEAVREYADDIGATAYAEQADQYYVPSTDQRIAGPADVVHDWHDFGDYTLRAQINSRAADQPISQMGGPKNRKVTLIASALATGRRSGNDEVYASALNDVRAGRRKLAQEKFDFISQSIDSEFADIFSGMDAEWRGTFAPAAINGDPKPSVVGTVEVKSDDFVRVLARAAAVGKRMGQPNVFVTEETSGEKVGFSEEGHAVVPAIKLSFESPIDETVIRELADSNPSVMNGAVLSQDGRELQVFMVPGETYSRADAASWTEQATQSLDRFFDPLNSGGQYGTEGPVKQSGLVRLWNIGSERLGGKGRFQEYEAVLDILRTVAPDDTIYDETKLTFRTNERLRQQVQFALSLITEKPIELPKSVKFKRNVGTNKFQMSLAKIHEAMPMNALESDPMVRVAYESLVRELGQQMRAMNLEISFMPRQVDANGKYVVDADGDPIFLDPYGAVSANVFADMKQNQHLYVYPTTPTSFGGDKESFKNHPLLEVSPFKTADGEPMLWNDVLRAVHDAIAHGLYGASFGKDGEEMAFVAHALITKDPLAIMALSMETRMQNSWVNFNPNRVDENGEPIPDAPLRFADQKVALPPVEACFTGVQQIDDRLRAFSAQMAKTNDGYNGTLEYLARSKDVPQAEVPQVGAFTVKFDDVVVINDPSVEGAQLDPRNMVVSTDLTKYGDALPDLGDTVSSVFSSPDLNADQLAFEASNNDVTLRAQVVNRPPVVPLPGQRVAPPKGNPLWRVVSGVNQVMRSGASGDASPILMQNFLNANLFENPDMLVRQFKLLPEVLLNPNLGFQRKDGTIINAAGMRGRKVFDDVLETEVRSRRFYEDADVAGLSLAAVTRQRALQYERETALAKLQQTQPNATMQDIKIGYEDIDELGYNSDQTSDVEFLKHMPGQGTSERFFALSKDIVKMNAFEQMANNLVQLGYNPTNWTYDADGKLIETPWTRAMKDLAALINITSGDVRFVEDDEQDEIIGRLAKLFFFAPRWLTSRLMLDRWGRFMFETASSLAPGGREWAQKVLAVNGMSSARLATRDKNISKMHGRLLWKAWAQWIAIIMALYSLRLGNPQTMGVSIEGGLTKFKFGEFQFRMPGAVGAQIELLNAAMDAANAFKEQKPGPNQKNMATLLAEAVSKVVMSRASPVIGFGLETITKRDAFGIPSFGTDEALDIWYKENILPGLKAAGIKGLPTDAKLNRAITKRLIWWWASDMMEMYSDQRNFGRVKADSLLRAALTGAWSSLGGRMSYIPKAGRWKLDAAKNFETSPEIAQWLSGTTPQPVDMGAYDAEPAGTYTAPVPIPLFGGPSDYTQLDPTFENYATPAPSGL